MGVFESRNLDFDDVYILNMNEGNFPKSSFNISFIPFNIRKAFNLDTSWISSLANLLSLKTILEVVSR